MLNSFLKVPSGVSSALTSFLKQHANEPNRKIRDPGWALVLTDGGEIEFDTILNIDVDSTNKVMQSPTEMGGFVMYNKAVGPTLITLEAAITGSDEKRAHYAKMLMDLSGSTDLLNLITPDYEFTGFNCDSVKYSRSAEEGVDAIYFTISLTEIRQVEAKYTNARVNRKSNKGKKNGNESALSGLFGYF